MKHIFLYHLFYKHFLQKNYCIFVIWRSFILARAISIFSTNYEKTNFLVRSMYFRFQTYQSFLTGLIYLHTFRTKRSMIENWLMATFKNGFDVSSLIFFYVMIKKLWKMKKAAAYLNRSYFLHFSSVLTDNKT